MDPDLEKSGPRAWKNWTPKNLDPETAGLWKTWILKNMKKYMTKIYIPEFRELCLIKTIRNLIYCLKVFQAINVKFSKYQKQSSGGVL